jgi:hypothetical protein
VHFISDLMAHHVEFIVTALGRHADPFILHLYAALVEKELGQAGRTANAVAALKQLPMPIRKS